MLTNDKKLMKLINRMKLMKLMKPANANERVNANEASQQPNRALHIRSELRFSMIFQFYMLA
jgi:hypothetical protein